MAIRRLKFSLVRSSCSFKSFIMILFFQYFFSCNYDSIIKIDLVENIRIEVMDMKVRNIMSKEVTKLNPDDSIERAAQLMKQHNIGSIPVCDQEKVVGIVTDRDIATRSAAKGQNVKQQKVCDIMSQNPVVGNPEMDVHEVAKLMSEKQIRRVPIVENNTIVGVVALGDISVQPNLQDNAGEALKNISQSSATQM